MAYFVNALFSHELEYEILVRGIQPSGNTDDKRKILRGLLSQESANRSFAEIRNTLDFEDDHAGILDSLPTLEIKVVVFNGNKNDNKYKSLTTRFWHLSGRISRMNITSDEEEKIKQDLQLQLLLLEGEIDNKIQPATSTPVAINVGSDHFNLPSKSVPVYKWGLAKFTEEGSLMAFLEKVETYRVSRSCTTDEVFASAGDLFDSHAWTWWHNNHSKGRFHD